MSYKILLDRQTELVVHLKQVKSITLTPIPYIPFEVGMCSVNTSWQASFNGGTILLRSLASLTGTLKGAWQSLTGMLNWLCRLIASADV